MSHLKPGKPTPNGSQEGTVQKTRCSYCGEKHVVSEMIKDVEGNRFCDGDCKEFFMEEEVEK